MNRVSDHPEPYPGRHQPATAGEEGFMLVAVVVMTALVLIALSVAAPVVARQLQRDKEVESEHRAEQYVRAIRLYYRKFNTYPPSIDALKESNNIRFLRQEYVDPLTGKADWRILHQGQQKTTIKGFFGQELGGIGASGLGSASSLASGGATGTAGTAGTTIGATSPLASGFGGATVGGSAGTSGATGSTGLSSGLGSLGGAVSGGPIVGVGTAATGDSIATPNQQKTYETWEFWYDPRIEQLYQKGQMNAGMGGGGLNSQSAAGFGSSLSGQPNATPGTGSSFGGSSFGSSSFGGSSFGSPGATTPGTGTATPGVTPQGSSQ